MYKRPFVDRYIAYFIAGIAVSQMILQIYWPAPTIARISAYILGVSMVFFIWRQIVDMKRLRANTMENKIIWMRMDKKVPGYIPDEQVFEYIKLKKRKEEND